MLQYLQSIKTIAIQNPLLIGFLVITFGINILVSALNTGK